MLECPYCRLPLLRYSNVAKLMAVNNPPYRFTIVLMKVWTRHAANLTVIASRSIAAHAKSMCLSMLKGHHGQRSCYVLSFLTTTKWSWARVALLCVRVRGPRPCVAVSRSTTCQHVLLVWRELRLMQIKQPSSCPTSAFRTENVVRKRKK